MSVKIVTDSTCDLPAACLDAYGIEVVPLYINFANESLLDGKEITRQEFYQRLPMCKTTPTTAAPGTSVFCQAYSRLVERGATSILSIHISPTLSSVLKVAQLAASQFKTVPVKVLDSRVLSMGTGFIVLKAAEEAARGLSMDQILAKLNSYIPRAHVFAALDTMEYLRRSGRVNGLVSGIGNLLRLKPLLKMNDGVATSERVRTNRRAFERLIQLVSDLGKLAQIALVHTNAEEKAQLLWDQARHLFPDLPDPLSVDVTPVLGVHLGPGAVGFACVAQE